MPRLSAKPAILLISCLPLLPFITPPAFAATASPLRCVPEKGTSKDALARLAIDTRLNDSFYNRLVGQQGQPSSCKGSIGKGESAGETKLILAWPDGSTFEQSALLPETSIVRYSNARGFAHAADLTAAFRNYAARYGLRIDWTSARHENRPGAQITEYRDPRTNGFVRFTYDRQQRLVAAELSIAL
jgi:hypothetical protein